MRRNNDSLKKLVVQERAQRGRSLTYYLDQIWQLAGTSMYSCIQTTKNINEWLQRILNR